MKKVYPVRYERNDNGAKATYFIVATNSGEAKEIAFSCIANNPPPSSIGPDRSSDYGRKIAKVWVEASWAQPTECDNIGLIGSGSEVLLAKALALYVKEYNQLH